MFDNLRDTVADMSTDERLAFARGLVVAYSAANSALTASKGDVAKARIELQQAWEDGPRVWIDEITDGVRV